MSRTLEEMAEDIARHEAALAPEKRPTSAIAGKPNIIVRDVTVKFAHIYRPFIGPNGNRSYSISVLDDESRYAPEAAYLFPKKPVRGTDDEFVVAFQSKAEIAVVHDNVPGPNLGEMLRYCQTHNLNIDMAIVGTRVDIACEIIDTYPLEFPGSPKRRKNAPVPRLFVRAVRIDREAVMKNIDNMLADTFR